MILLPNFCTLYTCMIIFFNYVVSDRLFSGHVLQEIGYTTTSGKNFYLHMNSENDGRAEFVNPGPGNKFNITPSSDNKKTYIVRLGKRFTLGYEKTESEIYATFDDTKSQDKPKEFVIKAGRRDLYAIRFGDNCMLFHGKGSSFSKRTNVTSVDAYFECNDAYSSLFTHVIGTFWIKNVDDESDDNGKMNQSSNLFNDTKSVEAKNDIDNDDQKNKDNSIQISNNTESIKGIN